MNKWNLIVDVAECNNCNNCTLALKDELSDNDYPGYSAAIPKHGSSLIQIQSKTRGSGTQIDSVNVPSMCNHCDDAPCVKQGNGAVKKRPDGIVLFDPIECKGRRDLIDACPYGAVHWNEELQLPQNWFFDAHLLDEGWAEPRCVSVCPTGALQSKSASDEEMDQYRREHDLEYLGSVEGTRPRVYYKNLYRLNSVFIAGCLVSKSSDDLISNASVQLLRDGELVQHTETDDFGEFKFDRLVPHSGPYSVRIDASAGCSAYEQQIELTQDSVVLGPILV